MQLNFSSRDGGADYVNGAVISQSCSEVQINGINQCWDDVVSDAEMEIVG